MFKELNVFFQRLNEAYSEDRYINSLTGLSRKVLTQKFSGYKVRILSYKT